MATRGEPRLSGGVGAAWPELVSVVVSGNSSEPALPAAVHKGRRPRTSGTVKPDGAIEIALPGGVRMTVRRYFEERTLRAVLGALRPGSSGRSA
jgi:hypothetical protein